jgi:hypothetical protein
MGDNSITINMDHTVRAIADRVESAMKAKGIRDSKADILAVLNHPKGGPDEAVKHAAMLLGQDPGDSWSGRTNDMQRAYNDGVRRIASQVLDEVMRWGGSIDAKFLDRLH